MTSRFSIAIPAAILAGALLAPSGQAQGRGGMRASAAGFRARSSFGISGREGFGRSPQRRFLNEPGYLFAPYFYSDDDYDYEPAAQDYSPAHVIVPQPAQAPAPAAAPGEPLLMEMQDGKWVRVPTGGEMQLVSNSTKPDAVPTPATHAGLTEIPASAAPLPELPPAVIVFRDGHTETVQRYMIQGTTLYTSSESWSAGSLARKIPLSEVDIPASLKINKERGTRFNLPSSPNEIVVRF